MIIPEPLKGGRPRIYDFAAINVNEFKDFGEYTNELRSTVMAAAHNYAKQHNKDAHFVARKTELNGKHILRVWREK